MEGTSIGPILIFDKSALQSLSLDEACWLENFFLANVTPLFYVETLADLEKQPKSGRTAEEIVGELAHKTLSQGAFPNIHHQTLLERDLLGNAIEMTNRPLVRGGQPKRDPEGKLGIHFDQFPEMAALDRWYQGDFYEIERQVAKQWRASLSSLNFDATIEWIRNIIPKGRKFKDLPEIKEFVDRFVQQSDKEILYFALQLLGIPSQAHSHIIARYKQAKEPSLHDFAPYAAYVLRVDLFFYISLSSSLISKDRPSNKIDLAYLYYLPFCMAFVSSDKLHAKTAPLFMEIKQEFVKGGELKQSLKEVDDYFSKYAAEIEKVGIMRFAPYPPQDLENAVTRLWGKFCPLWRQHDNERKAKKDSLPDDKSLVDRLNKTNDESQPVDIPVDGDSADYVMIKRKAPIRKGKWRILPPEVEKGKS